MALGWDVRVFRVAEGALTPPASGSPLSGCLAKYDTGMYGLDWLEDLVRRGHAIRVASNGYPSVFTAPARYLLPEISAAPPSPNPRWLLGPDDVISEGWAGREKVDADLAAQCDPDEWLVVHAWDRS